MIAGVLLTRFPEGRKKNPSTQLLNMIQKGIFGDIVHAETGYMHDLRLVKYDPEREP